MSRSFKQKKDEFSKVHLKPNVRTVRPKFKKNLLGKKH